MEKVFMLDECQICGNKHMTPGELWVKPRFIGEQWVTLNDWIAKYHVMQHIPQKERARMALFFPHFAEELREQYDLYDSSMVMACKRCGNIVPIHIERPFKQLPEFRQVIAEYFCSINH